MTVLLPLAPAEPRREVRRIVAASGSSFAAGMAVLPRARRDAIFALYAFCRVVDDIADGGDPPAAKASALHHWEEEVRRAYRGEALSAVGRELARAARAHDLPQDEFLLVLEGMRMDAAAIVAPAPEALDAYVRRVAGAVGILSMRVFGAWVGLPSEGFALALARAVQLTNILRDVEEDAGLGRLYLPAPVLAQAGVPAEPRLAVRHPGLPEARRLLGLEARLSFREARGRARGHAWGRLLPALMMMGPYEALLGRMERDWAAPPARSPGWRKAAEGGACALRGLLWA